MNHWFNSFGGREKTAISMAWNFRNVKFGKENCLWIEEMDSDAHGGDGDGGDDD